MTEKTNKKYNLIILGILIFQILTIIYYGHEKSGFYVDEYYSYFSSNRSIGLYYPDREWQDTETVKNEFVVLKGEGFNYPLVSLVQSWDVHPPLFYDLLHTACSLFPGVFSKWLGLGINIIAFVICFILLYALSVEIHLDPVTRAVTLLAFGFNPMTISCVMFIRMYMWLTVFVLASALLHVKLVDAIKDKWDLSEEETAADRRIRKYCISIGLVDFLGFMTQYYYLIFMVMIGFFFFVWLIFIVPKKDTTLIKKSVLKHAAFYVCSSTAAMVLSVLVYPSCVSHILRGYRGKEAVTEFVDGSNFFQRIGFFTGLVNDYLLSGYSFFVVIAVLLIAIGGRFFIRVKNEKDRTVYAQVRILVLSVICYFVVVAKTALLLGDTSNRYEMPVYPLIILIAIYFVKMGFRIIFGNRTFKNISIPVLLTAIVFSAICSKGLFIDKNVLFLYPEDKAKVEYARAASENGDALVICFNDATPDNVWRLSNELFEYSKGFYVSEGNTEAITDKDFLEATSLSVYVADCDNKGEVINNILNSNPNVTDYEEVFTEDMWTMYHFY